MAKSCCEVPHKTEKETSSIFKIVLWIALALNAGMFFVEAAASFRADSVSLLADAVDFLGDAGNYAISLIVLPLAMQWRSRAAFFKGLTMFAYGIFVLARIIWLGFQGNIPEAGTMGSIGFLALVVNFSVALMLFKFREGDANQKSVWICSRNDAIGNIAVIFAAGLVSVTHSNWPDLLVAFGMSWLAISGGFLVIKESRLELRTLKQQRRHDTIGLAH
jgi:Co/Zn/Cd efflux system component